MPLPTGVVLAPAPVYGSDKVGLVCAYVFAPGVPARPLTSDEAETLLITPDDTHFLWLHFSLSNANSAGWLREHVALPHAFYELPEDRSSTRLEVVDGALVGVL